MHNAAIYVRHRTPARRGEASRRLKDYAERERLKVVRVLHDEPTEPLHSAPHIEHWTRAGEFQALDLSERNQIDFLILESLDALCEETREALESAGVRVVLEGQFLNLKSKPKQQRRLKSGETLTERLVRGRKAGAAAGYHQSGPAPYGYRRNYPKRKGEALTMILNPKEADIVRLIFKQYLRLKSLKKLLDHLNLNLGSRTRRGREWSRAGLSWILHNETYLGRVHFAEVRARGKHPAIVSPIIFNKANKLLRKNCKSAGKAYMEAA